MNKTLIVQGIWGIILPRYIGIIISQYKDPYRPTSIMECQQGFERCSIVFFERHPFFFPFQREGQREFETFCWRFFFASLSSIIS